MTTQIIRVAILDDDSSFRTALGRLLKATGMVVQTYETADQFFESLSKESPDCLLLDLQMPGMNGRDVLKYLGQRNISIPTIVITGSGASACRSYCANAGVIACLDKPLDAGQLIQTIEGIVGSL